MLPFNFWLRSREKGCEQNWKSNLLWLAIKIMFQADLLAEMYNLSRKFSKRNI